MLWSMGLNSFPSNSSLEALLDRGGYTLEEVLEEECLLSEVKSFNKRLMTFLQQPEQVRQMINFIISKPPHEAEDQTTVYKYSFVSCAIVACEIDVILKAIADDEQMLDLLFSFLEPEHNHSNLLAGYFSKVVICLLIRKTEQLVNYIQNHRDILSRLVDLIGITSIMEVLIRVVDVDDNRYTWNFQTTVSVQWLAETDLLERLIDKLSPNNSPEAKANAAAVLCTVTRVQQPALGRKLSGFVGRLFNQALENVHSKAAVVQCLSVCISLLDPKRTSIPERSDGTPPTDDPSTQPAADALDNMLLKIGDILKLLDVSDDETCLPTTYGELRPPLGIHRLKVVEFMAALLKADTEKVGPVFIEYNTLQQLVTLFFNYPFNNMLHHQVEAIISLILDRNDALLMENLLKECDLVSRILGVDMHPYDMPEKYCSPSLRARTGNIGHLTRIANKLALVEDQNQHVQDYLQENEDWQEWKETILKERNAMENVYQWACGRPMPMEDRRLDSDEDDFHDRDFDVSAIATNVSHEVFRYGMFDHSGGEQDVFFDDESVMNSLRLSDEQDEIVINSLRLSDEQESARLFGNQSSWFAFQEEASNGPLSSGLKHGDQIIRFSCGSSSSSSDDDEDGMVADEDYEFSNAEASSRELPHGEGLHKLTIVDITSEFKEDLTEAEGNHEDGESSQFDGGTAGEGKKTGVLVEERNGTVHGKVDDVHAGQPGSTTVETAVKEDVFGEVPP